MLCGRNVCLHYPDGNGRHPGCRQYVLRSQDHLAAAERDRAAFGFRLSGIVPDAHGPGDIHGLSVPESRSMTNSRNKTHPTAAAVGCKYMLLIARGYCRMRESQEGNCICHYFRC